MQLEQVAIRDLRALEASQLQRTSRLRCRVGHDAAEATSETPLRCVERTAKTVDLMAPPRSVDDV